jgi:ATPase family protein associated with various cellular activities (AAA)
MTRQGGRANDSDYPKIRSIKDVDEDEEQKQAKTSSIVVVGDEQATTLQVTKPGMTTEVVKKDSSYIKRLTAKDIKKNKNIMIGRPKDLMFLSPMLKGYCLKAKLWLQFYVDDVRSMVWNLDAYDHLVYPEEQKDLVLSFVSNHNGPNDKADDFDDVIKGKGRGLVMLLSGPPGTGKTLTAEAVADKTHRPLLYMHAEDLGVNPATLGANLKKMFEMAAEWNAVCLLDECDVFLSARNPVDIARNELVSIFLREIEYFQGVLFLTTNLFDSIDTAFRSRMSIHLRFNPLTPESRVMLWRKFLSRLPLMRRYGEKKQVEKGEDDKAEGEMPGEVEMINPIDTLTEEDLKELSLWELNGREIKCVIKTVKAWCEVKKFDFTLSRLEAGIKVTAPNSHKRGTVDTSLYDE